VQHCYLAHLSQIALPACRIRDAGAGLSPSVPGISGAGDSHFASHSDCVSELAAIFEPLRARAVSTHRRALLLRASPLLDTLHALVARPRRDAGCSYESA
jgi:hypothetical protein